MADMDILYSFLLISGYVLFWVAREHPGPNSPNQPLEQYMWRSALHLENLTSETFSEPKAIQTAQLSTQESH